jgi:hypothetical protein
LFSFLVPYHSINEHYFYCTIYVFVLCCTQADKANIVGESVDYIKALEDTLQGLERLKLERREDALNYCSVSVAPVRHLHLRCAMEAHQQTLCTPNIEVRMVGNKSFIGVSTPRQPGVVTKALCVLEKYLIDVVEIKIISCDQNRIMFFIRTCVSCLVAYCINYC